MAIISTYPIDATVTLADKLIGTDAEDSSKTKNYTVGSILNLVSASATSVLYAFSTVNQAPSVLDTPLQVTFGAAQNTATDPVMLDALGNITFNQTGMYLFNGFGNIERQGSSGGVSVLLFRALIDGVQAGVVKGFDLSSIGIMFPYETTTIINITEVGTVLTWEILRDSSGVNQGGMYTHTASSTWDDVPSAQIQIFKFS
jgi:hypothetical protein